jgi:hypothetical protein
LATCWTSLAIAPDRSRPASPGDDRAGRRGNHAPRATTTVPLTLPLEFSVILAVGASLFLLAAVSRTSISVTLILVALVFSDLLISLVSPRLSSRDEIMILQGFSFFALCIVATPLILSVVRAKQNSYFELLILGTIALLTTYWAVGCVINGLRDATMYYRLFLMPLLLILLGQYAGATIGRTRLLSIVIGVATVTSALVVVEFLAPRQFYSVTGAETFFSLKDGFFSLDNLIDSRNRRLFNLKIIDDVQVFKPAGPTLNYPSTAYVLLAGFTVALALSAWLGALWCLVGLAIVTAKAAVVGVLVVTTIWLMGKRLRWFMPPSLVIASGIVYSMGAIWILYNDLSIHAYSLLSTLFQVPLSPLGHGLGFGGSLTAERVLSWRFDMLIGDSGLAITLNMLGLPGLLLYYFYGFLLARALAIARGLADLPLLCFAGLLAVAIFNSVVQELAIGPYGVGLAGFLCAFRIAGLAAGAPASVSFWQFAYRPRVAARRAYAAQPAAELQGGRDLDRPAWSR